MSQHSTGVGAEDKTGPDPVARVLLQRLEETSDRLVLAESCTCGLVAALIGSVPGASQGFCGSAVTYREATKQSWLGVDSATLESFTAESQQTTDEMAAHVLQRTPEATISAAVTGHLGPDAPHDIDGVVYFSLRKRDAETTLTQRTQLNERSRVGRQREAANQLLEWILKQVSAS